MDDVCKRFHDGNIFSTMANQKVFGRKGSTRRRIFELIRYSEGLTCEEIEMRLLLKHQTVSARISELKRDGVIVPINARPTSSGVQAAVYVSFDKQTKGQQVDLSV